MNHKIVVFGSLSMAIHAVLIFLLQNPSQVLPSALSARNDTTLQVSLVKPVAVTERMTTFNKDQHPEPAAAAPVKNPSLAISPTPKATADVAGSKTISASTQLPVKQDSNRWRHASYEFVNFLNSNGRSHMPQRLAQATRSLHNKQMQHKNQQQHELQQQEKARAIAQRLNIALSEHFTYPRLAQRNGWQGLVKLGLRIEPNGQLSRIRVVSTSGFPVLDQAALETLHRISSLQNVDLWLKGSHFDTVLPVEYRLLGG